MSVGARRGEGRYAGRQGRHGRQGRRGGIAGAGAVSAARAPAVSAARAPAVSAAPDRSCSPARASPRFCGSCSRGLICDGSDPGCSGSGRSGRSSMRDVARRSPSTASRRGPTTRRSRIPSLVRLGGRSPRRRSSAACPSVACPSVAGLRSQVCGRRSSATRLRPPKPWQSRTGPTRLPAGLPDLPQTVIASDGVRRRSVGRKSRHAAASRRYAASSTSGSWP